MSNGIIGAGGVERQVAGRSRNIENAALEICLEMVNVLVSAILLSLCFLDLQGN